VGKVSVTVLIPAHNEAEWIERIVANLAEQTSPPSRIVVAANGCSDDTAEIAAAAGAEVFETPKDPHRKAGALNKALNRILPTLADDDFVFIQDADTLPVPRWLEVAQQWADKNPLAVVSGRYATAPAGWSMLKIVQENEFSRDGRSIDRRNSRTRIVVGTSALFRVSILREIIAARVSGKLPGPRSADVFSVNSITEDYELTLALKTLGFETVSPPECDAVTDVMTTVPALWTQRIRWQRGAFTDLRTYGLNKVTAWYYAAQLLGLLGMLTVCIIIAQVALVVFVYGHYSPAAVWIETLPLFIAYRILTVQRTGWKGMLVAALMVPETVYDFFRYGVYVAAVCNVITRRATRRA
jgi:biofilm PGA synthesis N-glycosyltransferase PgaC